MALIHKMEIPKHSWARLVTINDNPQKLSGLNKFLSHLEKFKAYLNNKLNSFFL